MQQRRRRKGLGDNNSREESNAQGLTHLHLLRTCVGRDSEARHPRRRQLKKTAPERITRKPALLCHTGWRTIGPEVAA